MKAFENTEGKQENVTQHLLNSKNVEIGIVMAFINSFTKRQNFRLVQTESIIADDKINVSENFKFVWQGKKTYWNKEKMLLTSIFYFSTRGSRYFLRGGSHRKLTCLIT